MRDVTGTVVNVGERNTGYVNSPVTTPPPADDALKDTIAALREAVLRHAEPGAQRDQAIEQVAAIGRAVEAEPPNGHALIAARDWLHANLPNAASALAPVLIQPTVENAINAAVQIIRGSAPGSSHPPGDEGEH
jgi:hypothetical protein